MPNGEELETPPSPEMPAEVEWGYKPEVTTRPGYLDALVRMLVAPIGILLEGLYRGLWQGVVLRLSGAIKDWYGVVGEKEDELWLSLIDTMVEGDLLPAEQAKILKTFRNLPGGFQSIFNLIITSKWLGNYLDNLSQITLAGKIHELNKEYSPNLPDTAALIRLAFVSPNLIKEIRELLSKKGFSEENINYMFLAQQQTFDPMLARDIYFRTGKDKTKAYQWMRELGFADDRIEQMMATWDVIPGPQDLLTMVAHEAFEPEMIERYGLGSEFPEAQSEWMDKQGLNHFWQERYWNSHWQHPGPGQILEMLHRQVEKPDGGRFSIDDVYQYYRLVEIPPYWRKMLADISYQPYTRVDTRRMHDMGVLGDADLVKAYRDQGYDEDHAKKMAEFTIAYNAKSGKDITQGQIIKAYRNSMISRKDASDLLSLLKWDEDKVEWILSMADWDEALEVQQLYVDAAKTRFVNNLTDEPTTRQSLAALNLPGVRIDALVTRWSTARIVDTKLPSKTDLDKFLKAKLINDDEYKIEMSKLGYGWSYINWYMQLAKK